MNQIAILTSSFGTKNSASLELCKNAGYEIVLNPYGRKLTETEVVELAKNSIGIVAGLEPLSEKVLSKLSKLRVISRCGTGLDNIDLACAERLKIQVFNTPSAPVVSVAELTLGLMLNLLRKVIPMHQDLRQGTWKRQMGNLLSGKNIGIIGFGRIGKKVADICDAFEAHIAFYDPNQGIMSDRYPSKSFDDLLRWADIVTLHCSVEKKSQPLLGASQMNLMHPGAWIINTSRGELIDEKALLTALDSGQLAGAALDVFFEEPYQGLLQNQPHIILTPHIGSYSEECREAMETESVQNLLKGLGKIIRHAHVTP